eukprot:5037391-Alexandrium_andersonii.AAC.1
MAKGEAFEGEAKEKEPTDTAMSTKAKNLARRPKLNKRTWWLTQQSVGIIPIQNTCNLVHAKRMNTHGQARPEPY